MNNKHKVLIILIVIILFVLGALFLTNETNINSQNKNYNTTELTQKLSLNMNNWNYDTENDIYYQLGLLYCTNPETTKYESLGIYVPGKYFDATKNENGTYSCTINEKNMVGNYTSSDAPIVMPIKTGGFTQREAPTKYTSKEISDFTNNGMIYVYPGCRGKQNNESFNGGAPWGVTDLKAAIRYIKFNNESIPGNAENIFTFGHSGGGAQSALLGTSGDNELYTPYLESIGAAMTDKNGNILSDSVAGSMCWCPIICFDYGDSAYEWNMGQYSNSGSRSNDKWTSSFSKDLAKEYATYINNLKLKNSEGQELKLEESEIGIYNNGTYYEYIKSVIEESLNNFLNDTEFPYSPNDNSQNGDNESQVNGSTFSSTDSHTYNNAQEYIDRLNEQYYWVEYNENNNTVNVINIEGFVKICKPPRKFIGEFDNLNRKQTKNDLFGVNNSDYLHFNEVMKDILKNNEDKYSKYSDFNSSIVHDFEEDLSHRDVFNNTIQTRVNMYNPLYYLCDYYKDSGSSKVAKYWRIHSGIEQTNCALTIEVNLALALNQTRDVERVEFETVWGQGHTTAERNGNSTSNFIHWINECLK